MGQKPFTFPLEKPHVSEKSDDCDVLKNRFSGTILFRSEFYNLVTGNLSALGRIKNKWFIEQILDYSGDTLDLNMLPALRKIASEASFEEGVRQRSSEITEKIEDQIKKDRSGGRTLSIQGEQDRLGNARQLLAGPRSPQTTEIFRLMRDRSPELKRLAICLVGKFRMTEMIPEVCGCLAIPGVRTDALRVLEVLGKDSGKELNRFYLTSAGNLSMLKAILRLIGTVCTGENTGFLLDIVLSNTRELKEAALKSLVSCDYRVDSAGRKRLQKLIFEIFGLLGWMTNIKTGLIKHHDNILANEVGREYSRWKSFLHNLLYLTYRETAISAVEQGENRDTKGYNQEISDLAKIIYGNVTSGESDTDTDIQGDLRRQKKLQHYYPAEPSPLKKLYEDLINCDYNLVGLWTKACTIRNIPEIDDENISETLVALLFSPEKLLQEEAARAIARSGSNLYSTVCERLPGSVRKKLDNIVAGITSERELLFEKVKFLSSCFPGINEDELVSLAENTEYLKGQPEGLSSSENGYILWCFTGDKIQPRVFVPDNGRDNEVREKFSETGCSFSYALKLDAVEEFRFQYPGSSFRILKYIDDNEG